MKMILIKADKQQLSWESMMKMTKMMYKLSENLQAKKTYLPLLWTIGNLLSSSLDAKKP
jgi:hypothetical protein